VAEKWTYKSCVGTPVFFAGSFEIGFDAEETWVRYGEKSLATSSVRHRNKVLNRETRCRNFGTPKKFGGLCRIFVQFWLKFYA